MKELLIKVSIDGDKIGTAMKHRGFPEGDHSINRILETIGILENLKQQMLNHLDSSKDGGKSK